MDRQHEAPARRWIAGLSLALAAATAIYGGYHLLIGLGIEDTNHLETPLALAVARQVTEGPAYLYGPFDGQRPLVLIHAPLYYRLAGLLCWPMVRLGLDPTAAALAAGRLISLLAHAATLLLVVGMARLDGASRRAGLWSALLVASAPIFGSFPVTVRPDTLGVFFQTAGAFLVLRAIRDAQARGLAFAYVAFGLAFATKQHDVVTGAVSSLLLAAAWRRGRLPLGGIVLAHGVGLAVVVGYYGFEQWLTDGEMARSVFALPAAFRRITPADWSHVVTTFLEIAKRSLGLLALGGVAVLACRRSRPSPLTLALGLYLIAELAATALLCRGSTGAWVNYAMQAVVFAAILTGKALADRLVQPSGMGLRVAVGLAALLLLAVNVRLAAVSARHRIDERTDLHSLLNDPRVRFESPDGLYFVGFPQHNRLYGRVDLAHDEWLYTAYEKVRAAEPRESWLGGRLRDGSVRIVVVPVIGRESLFELPGISRSLPELGFVPMAAFGRYRAWTRPVRERLARAATNP